MITHTRNLYSAFNPSKLVHKHRTHCKPWTHTQSSGQSFLLWCPGSNWGLGALLKGTLVIFCIEKRACNLRVTSLTLAMTAKRNTKIFLHNM